MTKMHMGTFQTTAITTKHKLINIQQKIYSYFYKTPQFSHYTPTLEEKTQTIFVINKPVM